MNTPEGRALVDSPTLDLKEFFGSEPLPTWPVESESDKQDLPQRSLPKNKPRRPSRFDSSPHDAQKVEPRPDEKKSTEKKPPTTVSTNLYQSPYINESAEISPSQTRSASPATPKNDLPLPNTPVSLSLPTGLSQTDPLKLEAKRTEIRLKYYPSNDHEPSFEESRERRKTLYHEEESLFSDIKVDLSDIPPLPTWKPLLWDCPEPPSGQDEIDKEPIPVVSTTNSDETADADRRYDEERREDDDPVSIPLDPGLYLPVTVDVPVQRGLDESKTKRPPVSGLKRRKAPFRRKTASAMRQSTSTDNFEQKSATSIEAAPVSVKADGIPFSTSPAPLLDLPQSRLSAVPSFISTLPETNSMSKIDKLLVPRKMEQGLEETSATIQVGPYPMMTRTDDWGEHDRFTLSHGNPNSFESAPTKNPMTFSLHSDPQVSLVPESVSLSLPDKRFAPIPAENPLLITHELTKSYYKSKLKIPVLKGVNFAVRPNEFVSIVGQSGSGKSTLLHLLGTLDNPDGGTIYFDNRRIDNLSISRRDRLRNRSFGFIFQFYHLLPELTTLENVLAPLMIRESVWGYMFHRRQHIAKAKSILEQVGLTHRLKHKPSELSGGEMQRAAIARALVSSPQILLADEPTGNLDSHSAGEIIDLLRTLNCEHELTVIMVTHDNLIASAADRTVRMVDGVIST